MQDAPSLRARSRAHGLWLRAHGTTITASAKPSQGQRVPVAAWLQPWEQHGAQSVPDQPRRGRPSPRRPEERDLALPYLQEAPQALTKVLPRFADTTNQRRSLSSLQRLATQARRRGKRVRKSRQRRRAPDACAQATRALEALPPQADQGPLALYYWDASGFGLAPTRP